MKIDAVMNFFNLSEVLKKFCFHNYPNKPGTEVRGEHGVPTYTESLANCSGLGVSAKEF